MSARAETAIWGLALVGEATIRVGLSYVIPTGVMVAVSPLVAPIVLGPVALWAVRARRRQPAPPEPSGAEPLTRAGR